MIYFILLRKRSRGFSLKKKQHDNQADVIDAFNSTSKYLDDLFNLNIDNPYFEGMVNQITVE